MGTPTIPGVDWEDPLFNLVQAVNLNGFSFGDSLLGRTI